MEKKVKVHNLGDITIPFSIIVGLLLGYILTLIFSK